MSYVYHYTESTTDTYTLCRLNLRSEFTTDSDVFTILPDIVDCTACLRIMRERGLPLNHFQDDVLAPAVPAKLKPTKVFLGDHLKIFGGNFRVVGFQMMLDASSPVLKLEYVGE